MSLASYAPAGLESMHRYHTIDLALQIIYTEKKIITEALGATITLEYYNH